MLGNIGGETIPNIYTCPFYESCCHFGFGRGESQLGGISGRIVVDLAIGDIEAREWGWK